MKTLSKAVTQHPAQIAELTPTNSIVGARNKPVATRSNQEEPTLVLDGEVIAPAKLVSMQINPSDLETIAAKVETGSDGRMKATFYFASKKRLNDVRIWLIGSSAIGLLMWAYKAGAFKKLGF